MLLLSGTMFSRLPIMILMCHKELIFECAECSAVLTDSSVFLHIWSHSLITWIWYTAEVRLDSMISKLYKSIKEIRYEYILSLALLNIYGAHIIRVSLGIWNVAVKVGRRWICNLRFYRCPYIQCTIWNRNERTIGYT